MSIIHRDTTHPSTAHPAWCHPLWCTTDGDVDHSTAPQTWTAALDDVEITARLRRDDERLPGGGGLLPHEQGVELGLVNTACVDGPTGGPVQADVFLSLADAERLAIVLFEHVVEARRGDVA